MAIVELQTTQPNLGANQPESTPFPWEQWQEPGVQMRLLRIAYNFGVPYPDLGDFVDGVLVRALEYYRTFTSEKGNFGNWVIYVANSYVIDAVRRENVRMKWSTELPEGLEIVDSVNVEDEVVKSEEQEVKYEALLDELGLSAKDRELFSLIGQSLDRTNRIDFKWIGEQLGLGPHNINVQVQRRRQAVKERILRGDASAPEGIYEACKKYPPYSRNRRPSSLEG